MTDYNINAVARRAVFSGSAGVGPYAFTFEVLANTDIAVYKNTVKLTLASDYTVTINANGTGSVTLTTAATSSDTVTLIGARDIERTTDFTSGGEFRATAINDQLDSLTIFDQQLAEENKRALMAPPYDPAHVDQSGTLDMTLPAKASRAGKTLAFNATTGNPEAGPDISSVQSVADASADINTVAGIAANVTTVAGISSNVTAVAGNTSNIAAVGAISANITTVAGISSNVTTVAGISSDVTTVAGIAANVTTVAGISSDVTTVAGQATNMQNITDNLTAVQNAATNATNAASSASAAATSATNAATSETNAGTSETNAATSETNASNSASAAATSATNAATSATNASTSETNAATSETNSATSATNAATSATAASASQVAAAASAASAAASYDTFDDRYLGTKTSNPTVDNDGDALVEGALYFNSTANEMRVYDGANWIAASSAGSASLLNYHYTATAAQTTFSGADDNSATLSYTVNNLIVTLNGVVLEDGTDYTATNGTSVVLTSGAALNDELNIVAFKSFTTADMVSATNGGTFQNDITISGDLTVDTDTLYVDSTNNRVGVGTVSPSAPLEISTSSGDALKVTTSTGRADIWLTDTDTTAGQVRLRGDANNLVFITNTTERMRLTSDGSLGLGTSSPSSFAKLHLSSTGTTGLYVDGSQTSDANIFDMVVRNGTDSVGAISVARDGANDAAALLLLTQATGGSLTQRMRIDSAGSIGIIGDTFGLISNGGQTAVTLASNAAINLSVSGTATAGGGILCVYITGSGQSAIYHVGYNRGNLISNSDDGSFATGSTSGKNTIQVSGHQITFTNRTASSQNYVFNLFIAGGNAYNQ